MLRLMRTGAQAWIIKFFLFGLLLAAMLGLALMDSQGMFRKGFKSHTVASVDGEKINTQEFDQLLQSAMRRQRMKPSDAYKSGYPRQYLDNEINSRVLAKAVHDYGIVVSDAAAAKQIKDILNAFPHEGASDKEALQQLLYNLGTTERALLENQKVDIGLNLLMRAISSGISAPQQMVTDAMKYQAESRRAEYFSITAEDGGKAEKPSDEDLKEYYKTISSRFMMPEYRTLGVLAIEPKALVELKEPTPAEQQAWYDQHTDLFAVDETRAVAQLVVPDAADAKAFYEEAKAANGDLKKVADAHKGKATYVKASPYGKKDIPVEISAAFNKQEGELLEPAETPLGWIVAKVEQVIAPHTRAYDDVKTQVKEAMEAEAANDNAEALFKRANDIEDMIAGGKPLSEVAQSLNLKEEIIEKTDAQGSGADSKTPALQQVLAAGFRLDKGGVSERIEAPSGELVFVEVREITPAEEQPFDKVRGDVLKAWQLEKNSAAVDQLSAKILDRLKLGEDFDSVAKSLGKKVTRTDMILRSDHARAAAMPKGMFPALFALEKVGQVTVVGGGNEATILRLADRTIDEKHEPKDEDVKAVRDTLDHAVQKDILEEFRLSLLNKYDVEVHEDVLGGMYKDNDDAGDTGTN